MPNILAIETSLPAASIALQIGESSILTETFESHRQQNQLLFAPLQSLLDQIPEGQNLDLIIIGTGPGSYSGSRISIAAAQGVAIVHGCPVVGMSSFLGTQFDTHGSDSIAVGDARRGAFFIANIPAGEIPTEPRLMDREAFDKELGDSTSNVFTLEPGMLFADGSEIQLGTPTASLHISSWLKLSEANKQTLLTTQPSPAYLRAPFITKAKPGHPLLRGKVKEH